MDSAAEHTLDVVMSKEAKAGMYREILAVKLDGSEQSEIRNQCCRYAAAGLGFQAFRQRWVLTRSSNKIEQMLCRRKTIFAGPN